MKKKVLVISRKMMDSTKPLGNTIQSIFKNNDVEIENLFFEETIITKPVAKTTHYFFYNENKKGANVTTLYNKKRSGQYIFGTQIIHDLIMLLYDIALFIKIKRAIKSGNSFQDFNQYDAVLFTTEALFSLNYFVYSCSTSKLIYYALDELYDYKRYNPFYFLRHAALRFYMKKIIDRSKVLFAISLPLKFRYEEIFYREFVFLTKTYLYQSCVSDGVNNHDNGYFSITYAGNTFYGRDMVICKLIDNIEKINGNGLLQISLNLFINSVMSNVLLEKVEYSPHVVLQRNADYIEVFQKMKNSTINLIVESNKKEHIRSTKYSFSTKILDCINAKRPILYIGPSTIGTGYHLANTPGIYRCNEYEIERALNYLISDVENFEERVSEIQKHALKTYTNNITKYI